MIDFDALRKQMVDQQLISRNITDERVLSAFHSVKRELFVPENLLAASYADNPLPINENQTISQPYIVALMVQLLELKPTDIILEIGTGSGYETAILSLLSKKVYTIERILKLHEQTKQILQRNGFDNIEYKLDDGSRGWGDEKKFDKIIVSAAATKIPEPLLAQLKDPGIMVIPVGERFAQVITVVKKIHNKIITERDCACSFVPLKGEFA